MSDLLKGKSNLNGNAQEIFVKLMFESMIKLIIINKISPNMQVGKPSYFKRRTPIMSKINNEIKILGIYMIISEC